MMTSRLNYRGFATLFALGLSLIWVTPWTASGEDATTSPAFKSKETDYLTFCQLDVKTNVLPITKTPPEDPDKLCNVSTVIQALTWKCADALRFGETQALFRKKAYTTANKDCEKVCEKVCEKYHKKCTGKLNTFERCGLENTQENATFMGKDLACRPSCEGRLYQFCSIYSIDFRSGTPAQLAAQKPNCFCKKK